MISSIDRALRAETHFCIAFIGAGGKTTTLFQLARRLPPPVIVTATSHLGAWQVTMADRHIRARLSAGRGVLPRTVVISVIWKPAPPLNDGVTGTEVHQEGREASEGGHHPDQAVVFGRQQTGQEQHRSDLD